MRNRAPSESLNYLLMGEAREQKMSLGLFCFPRVSITQFCSCTRKMAAVKVTLDFVLWQRQRQPTFFYLFRWQEKRSKIFIRKKFSLTKLKSDVFNVIEIIFETIVVKIFFFVYTYLKWFLFKWDRLSCPLIEFFIQTFKKEK